MRSRLDWQKLVREDHPNAGLYDWRSVEGMREALARAGGELGSLRPTLIALTQALDKMRLKHRKAGNYEISDELRDILMVAGVSTQDLSHQRPDPELSGRPTDGPKQPPEGPGDGPCQSLEEQAAGGILAGQVRRGADREVEQGQSQPRFNQKMKREPEHRVFPFVRGEPCRR